MFFKFMLLAANEHIPAAPDSGLPGYFAVNAYSARVVEAVGGEDTIEGRELAALQDKFRKKHCIGPDVVDMFKWINPNAYPDG
jgi:hypothetical protein